MSEMKKEEQKTEPTISFPEGKPITAIEKDTSNKSLKTAGSASLTLDSSALSNNLKMEQLDSMNLLNDTAKQLNGVMTSIIKKKEATEFQTLHDGDIYNICKVAENIAKTIKVKTEIMKVGRDLIKLAKEN